MSKDLVEKIADAVLYEGYLLYPYRSSAIKNRRRWNFGVLYPRSYSEQQTGEDRFETQTECLVSGGPLTEISVKLRCLRLVERVVHCSSESGFHPAAQIEVDGARYESWQEASECDMQLAPYRLEEIAARPVLREFALGTTKTVEELRDASGQVAGLIVRTQEPVEGRFVMSATALGGGLFRITVRVSNLSTLSVAGIGNRDQALARSLLSAHMILRLREGEFVSLLEPSEEFREAAAACQNLGVWPVLAGEVDQRDTMIASPIILYDYPQIAAESPGELFDSTEIDEILALRILTMTDEEKGEMRRSDERARRILERTEALPPEHFMKLHGALRGLRPISGEVS